MAAKKWFGPRVYCPRCGKSCRIRVSATVQGWDADAAVACRDVECGYTATVAVLYGDEWKHWDRSDSFKRNPVSLAEGQTSKQLPLTCPKCQGRTGVRTSVNESPFLRLLYILCETCNFRGKAYIQHLELLQPTSADIMRVMPLQPRLRQAYQDEYGHDPERWRKHEYDGTKKGNARLAGAAKTGHWNH